MQWHVQCEEVVRPAKTVLTHPPTGATLSSSGFQIWCATS